MTRDEAVEIATQAGRSNLAGHISALHEELDELHAKHGSTRVVPVPVPIIAPSGAGAPDGQPQGVAAPVAAEAPETPAAVLEHDPALDAPLTDEEIRDINAQAMAKAGVEAPDEEATSPEGFGLGSSTKPDHPDKHKSHKKGGR